MTKHEMNYVTPKAHPSKREIAELGKLGDWWLNGDRCFPNCLTEEKVFTCPCCGEKKAYIDLEVWSSDSVEDIINDAIVCAECYEIEMGDDL